MKRTTHAPIRALALLLAVMLMLTAAPLTAFAQTSDEDQAATPAAENVTQATSTQADTTATAMPPATLTAADIPEMLSATALAQRGTVRRVYEEETDASTLLFENNDGTRTMYLFGAPVKYIAPDGTMRDKSTAIATLSNLQPLWSGTALTPAQTTALAQNASIGKLDLDAAADALTLMSTRLGAAYGNELTLSDIAYATLDSDIRTLYPAVVTDGIVLNYGDYSIRTIPITVGNLTLPGMASVAETDSLTDAETRTRVRYNSVFGTGTVLQYTPTNMGVKEEIILTRNVGKTEFPFLLETGGLNIVEQNGSYVFLDPTTQNVIATLGEVIVYDSNGAITRGEMTVQTIREGLQYGVTLTVSEEFLANAAYPVSVDPTTDINPFNGFNEDLIQDASLYNDEGALSYTYSTIHAVGKLYDTPYKGQALYRFPGLYNDSLVQNYANLTSDQIISFNLHINILGGTDTATTLYINPYVPSWSAGSRICDSSYYGYYDMSLYNICADSIPTSGSCSIDITLLAREWLDQIHGISNYMYGTPSSGILIRNSDETKHCYIGTISQNPENVYATLDYFDPDDVGYFYLNSAYTSTFLGASGTTTSLMSGYITNIGNSITWAFEYAGNNQYYIRPNGSTSQYLNMWGDISTSPTLWELDTSSLGEGVKIIAPNGNVLGVTTNGTVTVQPESYYNSMLQMRWRKVRTSLYNEPTLALSDAWVPFKGYISDHYINLPSGTFTSGTDFTFNFSNTNIAYMSGYSIYSGENSAGQQTTLTVTHLPTGATDSCTIYIGEIPEGNYFIHNSATDNYITVSGSSNNDALFQQEFINQSTQGWQIKYQQGGYYTITPVDATNLYLTTPIATATPTIQDATAYPSSRRQWQFELQTGSNEYSYVKIFPFAYNNPSELALSASGNTDVELITGASVIEGYDVWELIPYAEYTVYHYYDNAYETRFSEYGNVVTRIQNYHNNAAAKISEKFKVVVKSVIMGKFTSLPDTCKNSISTSEQYLYAYSQIQNSNCDMCTDTTPCTFHDLCSVCEDATTICYAHCECPHYVAGSVLSCTERDRIVADFASSRVSLPNITYVIWTGHVLRGTSPKEGDIRAGSYGGSRVILMSPYKVLQNDIPYDELSLTTQNEESEATLVHELSHQFDAADHYCDLDHDSTGTCNNADCYKCVHSASSEDLTQCILYDGENDIYCSICTTKITAYVNTHLR